MRHPKTTFAALLIACFAGIGIWQWNTVQSAERLPAGIATSLEVRLYVRHDDTSELCSNQLNIFTNFSNAYESKTTKCSVKQVEKIPTSEGDQCLEEDQIASSPTVVFRKWYEHDGKKIACVKTSLEGFTDLEAMKNALIDVENTNVPIDLESQEQ